MRWWVVAMVVGCSSRQPPAEPAGSGSGSGSSASGAKRPADGAAATVDDNGIPIIRVDSKTTHKLVEHLAAKPAQYDSNTAVELSVAGARHALFDTVEAGKANTSCKVRVYANADLKVEYSGDHGCGIRTVAFSPDGAQLAIDLPDKLVIADLASGKTHEHPIAAEDARWIDAGVIVMRAAKPGARDRELALVDPATGATRAIGTTRGRLVEAAAGHVVVTRVEIENAVAPCPPADCFPAPKLGYDFVDLRDGKTTPLPISELSGNVMLALDGAVAIKSLYVLFAFTAAGKALPPRHIGFVGHGDIAALSKGGRYYALADDSKLRVYDVVAGTLVADGWANARVTALAFDGDARLVAYTDRFATYDLVATP